MKKILAWLTALSLLFCGVALAEESEPLRMAGGMVGTDYWKEHGIQTTCPNYHLTEGLALLRLDNAPDLYRACTAFSSFREMKDADVLADLSGSAVIREAVSRMRPEVQALATTADGRIIGLPTAADTNPVYWRQEAFDAAGLTAADAPQSYTELLDFAEKWAERVQKTPEKSVCFTDTLYFGGNSSDNYTSWLLNILLSTWEMQCYEAGAVLDYDTPEFIQLLERTQAVGKLLHKVEPSEKKCRKKLPLFWNQGGCSGLDGWFNGGRDYGLSHTIPFRITRDQPKLMSAMASLYVVRAGSAYTEAIIGHLEERTAAERDVYSVELYREGIAPGAYGTSYIERITEGWIKDRDEYDGVISFAPSQLGLSYEGAIQKFLKGKLSAEELAKLISVAKDDPNQ